MRILETKQFSSSDRPSVVVYHLRCVYQDAFTVIYYLIVPWSSVDFLRPTSYRLLPSNTQYVVRTSIQTKYNLFRYLSEKKMSKTLQEILRYAEDHAATLGSEEDIDHMVVSYHRPQSRTSSSIHTLLDGSHQLPPDSNLWKCLHQEEKFFCPSPTKRPRLDEGMEIHEPLNDPSLIVTDKEEEATAENSPPQPTADNVANNQQDEIPVVVEVQSLKLETKPPPGVPVHDSRSTTITTTDNSNTTTTNSSSSSSSHSSNTNISSNSNNKRPATADAFKLLMKGALTTHSKPFVMHFNLILTADKKIHVEILLQKTQGSVVAGGSHGCDTGD